LKGIEQRVKKDQTKWVGDKTMRLKGKKESTERQDIKKGTGHKKEGKRGKCGKKPLMGNSVSNTLWGLLVGGGEGGSQTLKKGGAPYQQVFPKRKKKRKKTGKKRAGTVQEARFEQAARGPIHSQKGEKGI